MELERLQLKRVSFQDAVDLLVFQFNDGSVAAHLPFTAFVSDHAGRLGNDRLALTY